jgi:hypothetical protein
LPSAATISAFTLLGYTGAKLPSDSFELVPIFEDNFTELELVLESCGFRHQQVNLSIIGLGTAIDFVAEPSNEFDPTAVAMFSNSQKIGYVNGILSAAFSRWLRQRSVHGTVDRINGRTDRPLVYVFTEIGAPVLIESQPV